MKLSRPTISTAAPDTLFHYTFPRLGIKVKFVKSNDLAALEEAITPKTKAVYAESIGNPKLDVADLEGIAAVAHKHGIPFVLDNTVSPYLLRPIDFGVDIVVYSATKFIGGHGTSLGGVIVDWEKFDWTNGKFPLIDGDDPAYHGLNFVEALKPAGNIAYIMKARVVLLRDLGPVLSLFNAFLFLQGLETLHLRMIRHSENALLVARHLGKHPKVAWLNYPGYRSSEKARQTNICPGCKRDYWFRYFRRNRGGKKVHQFAATDLASGQYWRRQEPRDPSGIDHALAVDARRTAFHRRDAGLYPSVPWYRTHRRHPVGHRPGAGEDIINRKEDVMSKILADITKTVGETPLVRLNRISKGLHADIIVKS